MKWTMGMATAVVVLTAAAARASDPVGIYAVIDKVALQPAEAAPERAQVWGVFRLATRGGDTYAAPARGYMYFSLCPGKEDLSRKEWADLKRVAGTGQCVAFAGRYDAKGTVRRGNETARDADPYPISFGLQKVNDDHPIAKELRSLPSPLEPTDGDLVPPGRITLRVRAVPAATAQTRYVFEIEDAQGQKETSEPVAVSGKEVQWSPKMALKAGESYTWRVWTKGEPAEKTAVTVSSLKVKGRS